MFYSFFSCFGKKRTKRSRNKGALRANAPPLFIPQPPFRYCSGTLKCSCSGAAREGYTGEGVPGARERDINHLPCADFFGYFLVRKQESNILCVTKDLPEEIPREVSH